MLHLNLLASANRSTVRADELRLLPVPQPHLLQPLQPLHAPQPPQLNTFRRQCSNESPMS